MKSIEKIIENYVYCGILGKNVLKLKQKNAVLGVTCAAHLEKIYTVIKAATGRVLATAQVGTLGSKFVSWMGGGSSMSYTARQIK